MFLDYEKAFNLSDWGSALDRNTILLDNVRVKPERRKELEQKLKVIYTNTSFAEDKTAMLKVKSLC